MKARLRFPKTIKSSMFVAAVFLLGSADSFGQMIADSSDFPAYGTQRYRVSDTIALPSLGIMNAGGADLTWDFTSDIEIDKIDTINYLDPSSTTLPFDFVYPTANYAVQVLPEQTTIFLSNTSTSHLWYGISNPLFPVPFSPGREFLKFDMEYGDEDTSMFGNDLTFPFDITGGTFDSTRVKNFTTEIFDYDAWGTFVDFNGDDVNSLRRKHFTISIDSLWGYTGGSEIFLVETIDTTEGFSWFGENTGVMANCNVDASGDVIWAEFFSNFHPSELSIDKHEMIETMVYPNPTQGQVTIEWEGMEADEIELYTLEGKLVDRFEVSSNKVDLNLSTYQGGLYLYRVKAQKRVLAKGQIQLNN